MKFQYKIIIAVFTLSIANFACTKFVKEADPSITQLVSNAVFDDVNTATSAVTNVYQGMYKRSYFTMSYEPGLLSDELTNYSTSVNNVTLYTNTMVPTSTYGQWNNGYNYIYQANAVIEGLSKTTKIDKATVNLLTGEAKFIRAFWHFYLVNQYGDIPLVLSTNYTVNNALPRTPVAKVYEQIISDLKDAQGVLSTDFLDGDNKTVTTERVRPTKWAATALLARAYLYSGDYINAEAQASVVINNTTQFGLLTDLKQVFLKNSKEAIWQLQTPSTSNNASTAGYYPITSSPTNYSLSTQLIGAFELGDARKSNWVTSASTSSVPSKTYYFPFKYRVTNGTSANSGTASTEYVMVLRFVEQILIRAEAEANGAGSGIPAAIIDINKIRNRAGLANYSGATDKASILNAIMHERQVELFIEWGHRWFDIIRTGTINSIMGAPGNVSQSKSNSTWNATKALYPIQQNELIVNGNLTQNPGY